MTLRIGFDYHGCLDAKPELFSELTKLLKDNGHEVHVLTGSMESDEIHKELKSLGIHYTHFFSVSDYNKEIGTKMWFSEDGNPWMDEESWNKTKGEYCKRHDISLHLEDTIEYFDHFTTPICRFYSKHIPKKVREIVLPIDET